MNKQMNGADYLTRSQPEKEGEYAGIARAYRKMAALCREQADAKAAEGQVYAAARLRRQADDYDRFATEHEARQ